MTTPDLRETVARAIGVELGFQGPGIERFYGCSADAAIAAAKPIIRAQVYDELIAAMDRECVECFSSPAHWLRCYRDATSDRKEAESE